MEASANTIDALQSKSSNSFVQATKLAGYELLFNFFDSEGRQSAPSNFQKFKFGSMILLQAVHMISILLEDPPIDEWKSFDLIWNVFLFTRIDYLFSYTNHYKTASIVLQSSLVCLMALCVYLAFSLYKGNSPRNFLIQIAKAGSAVYVKFMPIPTLIIILKQILYRDSSQQPSPFYIPLAILALVLYIVLYCMYTIGSAEIRHYFKNERIDSKNCSDLDIFSFASRSATITYFILNGHSKYSLYITILGEALIAYKSMKGLFYYNPIATIITTVCSLFVACTAFSLMVAVNANDAAVLLLLSLFVSPIVILGILLRVTFEVNSSEEAVKDLIEHPGLYSNHLEIEKVLRPFLFDRQHRELVLNAFSSCFMSTMKNKHKLLILWETYFCVMVLEDERLGRIKLSKGLTTGFSLEGDYQAFFCMKWLEVNSNELYEEVDFLHFRLELEKNKKRDKELCLNYYNLLESLIDSKSDGRTVNTLLKTISEDIQTVDEVYDNLCKKYSKNKEVVLLYISFLKDLTNNKEKAIYLEQKYGYSIKSDDNEQLNYFDESNAVMIISGEYQSIGIINYANDNMCALLKEHDLVGRNLADFLPQQFRKQHNSYLKRYIFSCTKPEIKLPSSIMLCNTFGYLIEVNIKIKCVAQDSYPFFLALIKPKTTDREIALLDSCGIVTNHTEAVPAILKFNSKNLIGFNLEDHIMNNGFCEFGDGHAYYIINNSKVLECEKRIFSSKLFMYRFYDQGSSTWNKEIVDVFKRTSLVEDLAKHDEKKIITIKNIKFRTGKGTSSIMQSRIEGYIRNSTNPRNESVASEQNKAAQDFQNDSSLNVFLWSIASLIIFLVFFTITNGIYVTNGLNSNMLFTSLYKTYGLRYALVETANNARNLDIVDLVSDNSENIFRDMKNYQEEIVDLLESCGKNYKVYNYEMFYWDASAIKRINLLDFANKLVRNIDDYFENRETLNSYKFIVKNANSFPYEYFKDLIEDLDSCIDANLSFYDFMIFMLIIVQVTITFVNLFIVTIAALKVRKNARVHWKHLVDVLSKNNIHIYTNLLARMENIHSIKNVSSVYKPPTKEKWPIPNVSLFSYIWRSLLVGTTFLFFIGGSYLLFHKEMMEAISTRRENLFYLGESSVNAQDLDFWTRETMFDGSLNNLLDTFNPLKNPSQKLKEVQKNIELLNLNIQKNKKKVFTSAEFDRFFDRSSFQGDLHPAGIYGGIRTTLMDSSFYATSKHYSEQDYTKFHASIRKLQAFNEDFFSGSVKTSEDLVSEHRSHILFQQCMFCAVEIVLILVIFINFIKEDKQIIQHKTKIFQIIRKPR